MRTQVRLVAVATVGALTLASCASLSVNSIPVGNSYGDGHDIIAEFANVLNLPDRAKVVMDGATVGVVTAVTTGSNEVDVTARIDRSVEVPSNVHAVLQQATVLGDIYLALDRPQDGQPAAQPLRDGGRIPLANTTSPPQLEDTLANLANFIGSGSIQRAQNSLIRINQVTPARDFIPKLSSRVATDLADLSNNVDTVDQMINGISDLGVVAARRAPAIAFNLSPRGVDAVKRNVLLANSLATVLPSLGSIYNGGYWLVPLLTSLADASASILGAKWAVEEEYPKWRRFFTDYFLPQDKYPAINITSIVGPDGKEMMGNVEQVLRMLGAVP